MFSASRRMTCVYYWVKCRQCQAVISEQAEAVVPCFRILLSGFNLLFVLEDDYMLGLFYVEVSCIKVKTQGQ